MEVFYYSLKGLRDQNEDAHKIYINGNGKYKNNAKVNFFAIYDGHGGKRVSKYLEENMYKFFKNKQLEYPLKKSHVNKIYDTLQKDLSNYRYSSYSGSTSLVVINFKKNSSRYLNILNTGDCRAVISKNSMAIPLTLDHKPNYPLEKKRIEQMGGKIVKDGLDYRIVNLSVSRAFGDLDATPYVTHRPDLFKYKLDSSDDFLIMGCDGLWDVLSNQDAVNFVLRNCVDPTGKSKYNSKIAKQLAEHAIKKGSYDNVSVIVIFFK